MSTSIIIVNWNTGKLLAKCLQSLQRLPEKNLIGEVIVVDNASTDDSLAMAEKVETDISLRFIASKENLGFPGGNNLGWKEIAQQRPDDDILLLNPDTEMLPGSLTAMQHALENNIQAGIVGPKLVNPDGSLQESVRSFPTLNVFLTFFFKLRRLVENKPFWRTYMQRDFNYNQLQPVDQVMGAAFLIRNAVIQEIGRLSEDYWIWFEEVDYCMRAKKKGWLTIYTPRGTVMHHGGTSFSQINGWNKTKMFLRSTKMYLRNHAPYWQLLVMDILTPIFLLIAAVSSPLTSVKKSNIKTTV